MTGDPRLLADVLAAVSSAADSTQVLDRVARLLVQGVGDICLADRLDDPDVVTRVAVVGASGPVTLPPGLGWADSRRSSSHAGGLLALITAAPSMVLRRGAGELAAGARSPDPRLQAQASAALALGAVDLVAVGLAARGQVLGVLTVLSTGAPLAADAVARLVEVAGLTALALDNARLLAAQRHVAAAMATSLLPPLPQLAGLTLAARYIPAAQGLDVGGDWYDAFVLPEPASGVGGPARPGPPDTAGPATDAVALVVGDTTGHDTGAATRMAELRNLLRALAADRAEPAAQVLARLDRTAARLGIDASATCLYARLEPPAGDGSRHLRWSSAGHLPPLLLRAGRAELLETPADLMLGVDADTARSDHARDLRPGDVLLLYSDGLVEDRTSSLDERLAVLAAAAERHAGLHPELLCERLIAELADGSDDDVALLVVRVDA